MSTALPLTFNKTAPIGGQYEWVEGSGLGKAVIKVVGVSTDLDLLELVDQLMDDGNTGTGAVTIFGPDLVYVIEK